MARVFAKNEKAAYGANIMLVFNPSDVKRFSESVKDRVRFVASTASPEKLDGLLLLPPKLA